jgi:hypothetical protein
MTLIKIIQQKDRAQKRFELIRIHSQSRIPLLSEIISVNCSELHFHKVFSTSHNATLKYEIHSSEAEAKTCDLRKSSEHKISIRIDRITVLSNVLYRSPPYWEWQICCIQEMKRIFSPDCHVSFEFVFSSDILHHKKAIY